jgi:hypothetical protein
LRTFLCGDLWFIRTGIGFDAYAIQKIDDVCSIRDRSELEQPKFGLLCLLSKRPRLHGHWVQRELELFAGHGDGEQTGIGEGLHWMVGSRCYESARFPAALESQMGFRHFHLHGD